LPICSADRLRKAIYCYVTAIWLFKFLDVLTLVQCASQNIRPTRRWKAGRVPRKVELQPKPHDNDNKVAADGRRQSGADGTALTSRANNPK
jgi:hypothetical protein